ncbi:hypothetical protein SNE40_005866 [Patella caerulea]|uniref:RING-type domain-containing protein n=1 Tax=Patella caerulea TaxID=87958 RepID=A0AAN8QC65_PATCE
MQQTNTDYSKELYRFGSFENYPTGGRSPFELARAGFYSVGQNYSVKCYFCGLVLDEIKEKPDILHRNLSPGCPFLNRHDCGNIPITVTTKGLEGLQRVRESTFAATGTSNSNGTQVTPVRSGLESLQKAKGSTFSTINDDHQVKDYEEKPVRPDLKSAEARRNLFVRLKWGGSGKQSINAMVDAGLYYTGLADCCRCFQCGGGLKQWNTYDDPIIEHIRWFPSCAYVLYRYGRNLVETVKAIFTYNDKLELTIEEIRKIEVMRRKDPTSSMASIIFKVMQEHHQEKIQHELHEHQGNQKDLALLKEENESLKRERVCCVCKTTLRNVVFIPCGHLVTCQPCGQHYKNTKLKCPTCHQNIEDIIIPFMS